MPHLQAPESTYFVTFRCRQGLFLSDEAKDTVMAAVAHWDTTRIDLDAAVVMPEHVHLIFRILDGAPLGTFLQSIKRYSARRVNRLLARNGPLWLDESFDHILRHAQEWKQKIAYIRDNPVKRGLVTSWRLRTKQ